MTSFNHTPVLLEKVITYLNVQPGEKYIDATLGGGGHTDAIIEKGGVVLGIDRDRDALQFVEKNLEVKIEDFSSGKEQSSKLMTAYGNFKDIKQIAKENGFENVSGILFDLGVSSYQLDNGERGFSIRKNAPLDMRMDANLHITAADIINSYSEHDLIEIFQRYGEEEQAQIAAAQIIKVRKIKRITTTGELVSALALTLKGTGLVHPATKIFQALRIEVNHELDALKEGLSGAIELLSGNGRIVVISFHSLEDRIAKRIFSDWENKKLGHTLTKKPITADVDEVRSNPRARSAKMRVFEKI